MTLPFPADGLLRITLGVFFIASLALRMLRPDWWARRAVRAAWGAALALALLGLAVSVWAGSTHAWRGMMVTFTVLVLVIPAVLALPLSALLGRRRKTPDLQPTPEDPSRRRVLATLAVAAPCAATALSASAIRSARTAPDVRRVEMAIPSLPTALVGLRILQLTDMHLGFDRDLRDLEAALLACEQARPDLVVLTGDIADDMAQLAPALRLIAQLRPRLGSFACLGNHEYHPGILRSRREFERGPIPLLVDASASVRVAGVNLAVLGVDDPLRSHDNDGYFRRAIAESLRDVDAQAFKLLLCHRPEGFDTAASMGVGLTLAGHTHGGQLGARGRSVLEHVGRTRYPWGTYAKGARRLYTSAGFGHWFPYRLGCPAEVPLIVLSREA